MYPTVETLIWSSRTYVFFYAQNKPLHLQYTSKNLKYQKLYGTVLYQDSVKNGSNLDIHKYNPAVVNSKTKRASIYSFMTKFKICRHEISTVNKFILIKILCTGTYWYEHIMMFKNNLRLLKNYFYY